MQMLYLYTCPARVTWPPNQARGIGLAELHKQGWFHGDVHEENVVLVGDQWVLQDWDWAHRGGEGIVCSRKANWDPALPFCNLLRPHRRIHGPNEELVIRYLTSRIFRDSSPEESRQADASNI